MAYPTTPELQSFLVDTRTRLDHPEVNTVYADWNVLRRILPPNLQGSAADYLQNMARTCGMVIGKGDENDFTVAFCLSEYQPERRELIQWPFEVPIEMYERARSKEAVVDSLWSMYERAKVEFENKNDLKLEWSEIRLKRDKNCVRGIVEFKEVPNANSRRSGTKTSVEIVDEHRRGNYGARDIPSTEVATAGRSDVEGDR